ncbi:hypothetical protein F170042I7_20470 [Blautia caecimuris]|uniref:transposase n=1 Tax=Blautia caecimuris TaxID=1796615 RepID=UPI0034BC3195
MIEELVPITVYTMNLRMYPTKEQQKIIDGNIRALEKACNKTVYDMFTYKTNTTEKPDSENKENFVHFPDITSMKKKEHLNYLRNLYPELNNVPARALSNAKMSVFNDLSKRLAAQVSDKNKNKAINGNGAMRPVEKSKPVYYNKKHPKRSYKYQEIMSKIKLTDNPNVMKFNLAKVGIIKTRGLKGYSELLRFGENGEYNFYDFIDNKLFLNEKGQAKQIFTTVKKDNCGDYFLQLCLSGIKMFKVIKREEKRKQVGIDVGVGSLMTLSNGEKYDNPRFKNGKDNSIKKHRIALYKKLSREYGFANEKFRNDYKEKKNKENIFLKPSKKYLETQNKISKLERKVARKRKHHMENMVLDIVRKYDYIAIETLSVKSMYT